MRGLFVTGTGTGVGKTILSAALLAAMRAAGERVRAHKPVVTGLAEPAGTWPADHELLALAAAMDPHEVAPLRFESVSSPHLAASLAGVEIDAHALVERALAAGTVVCGSTAHSPPGDPALNSPPGDPALIVEGVGGLLVPLTDDFTVRDLAARLNLPIVIAANPVLGTINHTLLTIEAARAAALDVRAVVLTPWPCDPAIVERSNRDTIARLGQVEVEVLESLIGPDLDAIANAGSRLPWRRWLRPA